MTRPAVPAAAGRKTSAVKAPKGLKGTRSRTHPVPSVVEATLSNGEPAPAKSRKLGVREAAAQATRDSILRAATKVFAKHGFDGGRVEQISKAAKSYDRMIYYYFGSKEGLFIAVLEEAYRRFNEAEATLELSTDDPVASLCAVARFMWRFYQKNPEFITLLNNENLHRGKHIVKSLRAREYSSPAVAVIGEMLAAGAGKGLFRHDVDARDVYLLIAALGYFYQSNRFTLSAFLGEELQSADALAHWEQFLIDTVLRTVAPGASGPVVRPTPLRAVAHR